MKSFVIGVVIMTMPAIAAAQNWDVSAREIGMGGVKPQATIAGGMPGARRPSRSIVLPFGLFQGLKDLHTFDPTSDRFNLVRTLEFAASPLHYIPGRSEGDSPEALFVEDVRKGELGRSIARYRGFNAANEILAEGLSDPVIGRTFRVHRAESGAWHAVFAGAGPYLSMRSLSRIDTNLSRALSTGAAAPGTTYRIDEQASGQMAYAIAAGYRGHFPWPSTRESAPSRDGLYLAVNYDTLRGVTYEQDDMAVRILTDSSALVSNTSGVTIDRTHASRGAGLAVDVGVVAVANRWEVGFDAGGLANRINWRGVRSSTLTLASLTAGSDDFVESPSASAADVRVTVPATYRANVNYEDDRWSAAADAGHGFGGGSFHGGVERRIGRIAFRGGGRYSFNTWNPSGGIGIDLTDRVGIDAAVFGTNANVERRRQAAIAASVRITR